MKYHAIIQDVNTKEVLLDKVVELPTKPTYTMAEILATVTPFTLEPHQEVDIQLNPLS